MSDDARRCEHCDPSFACWGDATAFCRKVLARPVPRGALKLYFELLGIHYHVRVFFNGANCGTLVFRDEEFRDLRTCLLPSRVEFIERRLL